MKRILVGTGVLALAALATTATATASPQDAGKTIIICHATGSELNPYVATPVSVDAINGPNDHMGSRHDEDIIPPNNGTVLPGGRNLHKMDWWEAGCKDPRSLPGPVVVVPEPVVVPVEPGPVVVVPEPVVVPVEPDPVVENPVVVPAEPGPVVENPVVVPVEPGPVVEDVSASAEPVGTRSSGPAPAGAVVTRTTPQADSGAPAGRNQGYSVQTAAGVAPSAASLPAGLAALLLACAAVVVRRTVRMAHRPTIGM